jgi:hypothetical protein
VSQLIYGGIGHHVITIVSMTMLAPLSFRLAGFFSRYCTTKSRSCFPVARRARWSTVGGAKTFEGVSDTHDVSYANIVSGDIALAIAQQVVSSFERASS